MTSLVRRTGDLEDAYLAITVVDPHTKATRKGEGWRCKNKAGSFINPH